MSTEINLPQPDEQQMKLWQAYEDVAMHFNDLIIRLRTQALGGVTAISALSAIAINFSAAPASSEQWDVIFGTLLFLMLAWIAIAILDLFYYHTLLLGAVDALLEVEKGTSIVLSTRIEQRFRRGTPVSEEKRRTVGHWATERAWPLTFYGIGFSALLVAAITTKSVASSQTPPAPQSQTLKVNVDRDPGEKLQLSVEPSPQRP